MRIAITGDPGLAEAFVISVAQVHILAEGVVDPLPFADQPPPDLAPATPFSLDSIRLGLPPPGGFGRADLRCAPLAGDS